MKISDIQPTLQWPYKRDLGWVWDNNPITFFHGTHVRNIPHILKNGIAAPTSGYTAGAVSLALDPFTARGYASMSGTGGETEFRKAGAKAVNTPLNERAVLVLEIPREWVKSHMMKMRGNMEDHSDKLMDHNKYIDFKGSDFEYYALTELRFPDKVPPGFIRGWMIKP